MESDSLSNKPKEIKPKKARRSRDGDPDAWMYDDSLNTSSGRLKPQMTGQEAARLQETPEEERRRLSLERTYFKAFDEWEGTSVEQIRELIKGNFLVDMVGGKSKILLDTSFNFQNGLWRMMMSASGFEGDKFTQELRERIVKWQDKLWGVEGQFNKEDVVKFLNGAFSMVTTTELLCSGLLGVERKAIPVEQVRHDKWLDISMATDLVFTVNNDAYVVQIKTIRGKELDGAKIVQLVQSPDQKIDYDGLQIKREDIGKMLTVASELRQRGKNAIPLVMFVPVVGQHGVDQYTGFVGGPLGEQTRRIYAKALGNLKDRVKS